MTDDRLFQQLAREIKTRDEERYSKIPEVEWKAEKAEEITSMLSSLNVNEKLKLTRDFFELYKNYRFSVEDYCSSSDNPRLPKVRNFFGNPQGLNRHFRWVGTLANGDRQFRIWDGLPASINHDYVDSCGRGLVLGVYGRPEEVRKYADSLMELKAGGYDRVNVRGATLLI